MKSFNVRFQNSAGELLAGRIDLPEDERPRAWAIFAHCFTCGKSLKAISYISRALTQAKIALLRFDFTGLGDSEGNFTESSNLTSNMEDLLSAAQWLKDNHGAPSILIGHSFGGTAVLHVAEHLPEVQAVAVIAAPFDPQHVMHLIKDTLPEIEKQGKARITLAGREFTIGESFVKDLQTHDSAQRIANLNAALLILHAPEDRIVSLENAELIYQAARQPKSFVSLDNATHLLINDDEASYVGQLIASWVDRYVPRHEFHKAPYVIDKRVTVRTDQDGFYTEIQSNDHAMIADEPVEYGGTGRGPTPYDYLMVALGACTTMTLQMYAKQKNWSLQSAVVRLTHKKIHAQDCQQCETNKGKIDQFERELELIGELTDEQRHRLLEIADRCPVHRTMHSDVNINTKLRES